MVRAAVFHVAPDDGFDDWIVRSGFGRELGHYPTREEAELAAEKIAREREADLIIHLPDGRTVRRSFARGWIARWFGR